VKLIKAITAVAVLLYSYAACAGPSTELITAGQPIITRAHRPLISADAHLNIKVFDIEQGINSSYINCILQDKRGVMWYGTDGAGLCRFDGNVYATYTKQQNLPDDYIEKLYQDKKGNIWVAASKGFFVFDGINFEKYTGNGAGELHFTSFIEDLDSTVIVASENGVFYCRNKELVKETHPFLNNNCIYDMAIGKDGTIYFATTKGLIIRSKGRFEIYRYAGDKDLGILNSTAISGNGDVYLAGTTGVFKVKNKVITPVDALKGKDTKKLFIDREGRLWLSIWDEGVILYDGKEIDYVNEEDGLRNKRIHDFFEDPVGNMWLGTDGNGVNLILTRRFVHYSKSNGLTENYVMSISQDKDGNIWSATRGGGVCKFNGTSFTCYTDKDGLPDNIIFSVKNDSKGNTYIGSYNKGLAVYDGKRFTTYDKTKGLSNNKIWRLFVDNEDNVFIAYYQRGFSVFKNGKFTHYTDVKGIKSPIRCFTRDKKGIYWIGTEGSGILRFDGKKFTAYSTPQGLCNGNVWDLYTASDGKIWIATAEGVSCFDGKAFTNYYDKDGLTVNLCWSVMEDKKKNIWVGTEKGINKMTFLPGGKVNITNYGINEGFTGNDATSGAVLEDRQGNIWWGSSKHLTRYQPQFDFPDTVPPLTQLTGIDIFFKKYDWSNNVDIPSGVKFSGTNQWFNYPSTMELGPDMNHLTFHFIGIDIPNQHKVTYQFRLEGFEDEWNPTTDQTEVTYSNIPPGKYVFHVMAKSTGNRWSKQVNYSFEVIPPIWKKPWFIILSIVLIISAAWGAFYMRTLSLRRNQRYLESEIEKRTEQLVEANALMQAKNKDITDSINYARNIQDAIIPPENEFKKVLTESFVIYKPKDIISGDFYWLQPLDNQVYFAAVDCTGHGVPGAMVSLVGHNELNRCVKELCITNPASILDKLSQLVEETFEKSQRDVKDGMDISLCKLNISHRKLEWAGANNPLWIVRKGEVIEFKADKQPIGKFDDRKPFVCHKMDVLAGDMLYVFTDGYADQFGGEKGKKFKYKQFLEILLTNSNASCEDQKKVLEDAFEDWKGDLEQIDDVCVIGVRVQ
jgi:ligand-binding sensor domain-containing protein/serine phosphatase RsbU (regulator of sigma subunit)